MPSEALTFTVYSVFEILAIAVSIMAAWFYLRYQFQANSDRLGRVEKDLVAHAKEADKNATLMNGKLDKLTETMIRIDSRGTVLESRFNEFVRRA